MIKNLIFAATVLVVALNFPSVAQAQAENFWIGIFEHEDGGGKEFEELIVKRTNGKLTATFQLESMAQLYLNFTLTVDVTGDRAYFYYDRCVPKGKLDYEDPSPCETDKNKKGDLMFILIKSVGRNKRPIIRTHAVKLADVNKIDDMFFEKVRHPYDTIKPTHFRSRLRASDSSRNSIGQLAQQPWLRGAVRPVTPRLGRFARISVETPVRFESANTEPGSTMRTNIAVMY